MFLRDRRPRFTIAEVTELIDALTRRDEEVRKAAMASEGYLPLPPELDDDQRARFDLMCHDVSEGALDALRADSQDPAVTKWRKGQGHRGIDSASRSD